MLYSEEQIQRANERSISEYFRQAGYSCKRVGSETHIEGRRQDADRERVSRSPIGKDG